MIVLALKLPASSGMIVLGILCIVVAAFIVVLAIPMILADSDHPHVCEGKNCPICKRNGKGR